MSELGLQPDNLARLPKESITNRDFAVARNRILANYAKFAPAVTQLRARITTKEDVRKNALGIGANGTAAVPLEIDGQPYILRVSGNPTKSLNIEERLEGAIRGLGIRGLEQVVAASIEEQAFISQPMVGTAIRYVGLEPQQAIRDSQLTDLIETVVVANAAGIRFDTDHSNIFFDDAKGFGIIDYAYKESGPHPLTDTLIAVGQSIGAMGRGLWKRDTPDDLRYKHLAISSDLMDRFSSLCGKFVKGQDLEVVQRRIGYISHPPK